MNFSLLNSATISRKLEAFTCENLAKSTESCYILIQKIKNGIFIVAGNKLNEC